MRGIITHRAVVLLVMAALAAGSPGPANGELTQKTAEDVADAGFLWVTTWGGSESDLGTSVDVDDWGNIFVGGRISSQAVLFDVNDERIPVKRGNFLARLTAEGKIAWLREIEGTPHQIECDSQGDILVAGTGRQVTEAGRRAEDNEPIYIVNAWVYLSRFDSDGNLMWTDKFDSADALLFPCVALDPDGSIILGCTFRDCIDLDPSDAQVLRVSLGFSSSYLIRLNAKGEFVWGTTWGNTNRGGLVSLAVGSSRSIFALGSCQEPSEEGLNPNSRCGSAFVSKMDPEGELIWYNSWGETADCHGIGDLVVDSSENVYISAEYRGTIDVDPGPGTVDLELGGVYISKFDTDGRFLWVRRWETVTPTALEIRNGLLYSAGFAGWDFDIDPDPSREIMIPVENRVLSIVVLSLEGELEWCTTTGGTSCLDLAVSDSGTIYITGGIGSPTAFGSGDNRFLYSPENHQSAFIAAFQPGDLGP